MEKLIIVAIFLICAIMLILNGRQANKAEKYHREALFNKNKIN